MEYALSKPGVYFVTMQQLLAWMTHPVAVERMDEWMKQERCNGPTQEAEIKLEDIAQKNISIHIEDSIINVYMESSGISGSSIALAGGSVVAVMAVLARRRRTRRIPRPQR